MLHSAVGAPGKQLTRDIAAYTMSEVRPNFLIVGAAKAATTSLHHWLGQHPEVCMSRVKEPEYFADGYGLNDWDKYLQLFEEGSGKKAVGESSTVYLSSPECAERIHSALENPKILIILRNPVDRAFSMYRWMVMKGWESIGRFEDALQAEESRFLDPRFREGNAYFWGSMYVRAGQYSDQVKRYFDTFGKESVRVYLFDDLVARPKDVYQDVCQFLDVAPDFVPDFSRQNVSLSPRSVRIQHSLRRLHVWLKKLPAGVRPRARSSVSRLMQANLTNAKKGGLTKQQRAELQEVFRRDVEELQSLISQDLSRWIRE